MTATVTTDASFMNNRKLGSYAFWITTEEKRIQRCGVLKGRCQNNHIAEIKAILNALVCLHRTRFSEHINKIVVNTDSMTAISLLQDKDQISLINFCSERAHYGFLPEAWQAIKLMLNAHVEFRHVKAHNGTDSKRKYVNDWCDKAAKKVLRKSIKLGI